MFFLKRTFSEKWKEKVEEEESAGTKRKVSLKREDILRNKEKRGYFWQIETKKGKKKKNVELKRGMVGLINRKTDKPYWEIRREEGRK